MPKNSIDNKGVILFIVLGVLVVVAAMASVIMSLILSQATFTAHQRDRIRAHYSNAAATNLAFEKLRAGAWATGVYNLCQSGCSAPDVNDSDIAYPVRIEIFDPGTSIDGVGRRIRINSTY